MNNLNDYESLPVGTDWTRREPAPGGRIELCLTRGEFNRGACTDADVFRASVFVFQGDSDKPAWCRGVKFRNGDDLARWYGWVLDLVPDILK